MNRDEEVHSNLAKDAFAGTAAFYARYRIPYPKRLLADLAEGSGVTGNGRLLALAHGPGRVALAIASSFREVLTVDLEPETFEAAQQMQVGNIRWIVGRAEQLAVNAAKLLVSRF